MKKEIIELYKKKKKSKEMDKGERIEIINNYLENKINYYDDYLKNFNFKKNNDDEILNRIFLETIIDSFGNRIVIS